MNTVLQAPLRNSRAPDDSPRIDVREPNGARHLRWLVGGALFAFAVPFVLADSIELQRDLFYGLYVLAASVFVIAWARHTGLSGRVVFARNWRWGVALGVLGAGAMVFVVLRTEDATAGPGGFELVAAVFWRGVVYGLTDGILLSVFPILAVFAAFARSPLRARLLGNVVIGLAALVASMGVTATYHLGYSEFRSEKLRKPVTGDAIWSAPTLLTLSPLGAPIAHAAMHVGAVLHSYEADTFLPPHADAKEVQQ